MSMQSSLVYFHKAYLCVVVAIMALGLIACGGGGGGGGDDGRTALTGGGGATGGGTTSDRLIVASDRATLNATQEARITVIVRNAGNVVQEGVNVFFGATDGILRVVRSITNEFGEAEAILSIRPGNPPAGTTITVFAETEGGERGQVDVAVVSGGGSGNAPTSISVTGPTTLAPNATGNFNVTISDSSGTAVGSRTIQLTLTRGNGTLSDSSIVTSNTGNASFAYTANNSNEDVIITLRTTDPTTGNVVERAITINGATTATGLNITGPGSLNPGETGNYTATLLDNNSNPVSGQTLSINSSPFGTVAAGSLTTNANGQVNFQVSTNGADNGTMTITASASGVPDATLDVDVTPQPLRFTFPANGQRIEINQFFGGALNWNNGSPVANTDVNFSTNLGTIDDDPNSPPAPAANRTLRTDGNGDIQFQIMSDTPGTATITATGGAESDTLIVEYFATASSVSASANPGTIAPTETSTITALVRDSSGNPLEGVFIQFIVDADGTNGSRTPASDTTDASGEAQTVFTAGNNTGFVQIRSCTANQALCASTQFNVQ